MEAKLIKTELAWWQKTEISTKEGVLLSCLSGNATLHINGEDWSVAAGSMFFIFPNEMVSIDTTDDFLCEALFFDFPLLLEASANLEAAVFKSLKQARFNTPSPILNNYRESIFGFLRQALLLVDKDTFTKIAVLQMRSLFLSFSDFVKTRPDLFVHDVASPRMVHFSQQFMLLLQNNYREHHDVAYYADRLCLSPRYLNSIMRTVTHRSPKNIIDDYVVMRLKYDLRSSICSLSQIAENYGFDSLASLTQYFRINTGKTPYQYKRELQK